MAIINLKRVYHLYYLTWLRRLLKLGFNLIIFLGLFLVPIIILVPSLRNRRLDGNGVMLPGKEDILPFRLRNPSVDL